MGGSTIKKTNKKAKAGYKKVKPAKVDLKISVDKKGGVLMEKMFGSWSFIIGVILALILGLASSALPPKTVGILASILVILGLIVGFLNVGGKEAKDFLLAATVLVIVTGVGGGISGQLGSIPFIGTYLNGVFTQLMAFVLPATIVAALKEVYYVAQSY